MSFKLAPIRQQGVGRGRRSIPFYIMAFLGIALAVYSAGQAGAEQRPATEAAEEGSLVPAAAPSDINIHKHFLIYLDLAQRALRDVQVDDNLRRQADGAIAAQKEQIRAMIGDLEAGRTPPDKSVQALPGEMAKLQTHLAKILGPYAELSLRLKLQTYRSEGLGKLAELRGILDELQLDATRRQKCNAILAEIEKKVELLPYDDATYGELVHGHDKVAAIFVDAHDQLARELSSQDRSRLGARFEQYAGEGPATQPAVPN